MICVHIHPKIARSNDKFEIILWLGEAFDYTIPFRASLSRISELLNAHERTSIEVPDYEENEDFIEGCLNYGSQKIEVYFEYSLGYMSLSYSNKAVLKDLLAKIQSDVEIN